jgi:aspartate kinase
MKRRALIEESSNFVEILSIAMIVYKFGGASVKDANGIRNLGEIVAKAEEKLVVVVSALGKTTNALEQVIAISAKGEGSIDIVLEDIKRFHSSIIEELLPGNKALKGFINDSIQGLSAFVKQNRSDDYDFTYDQIVSLGEIWSTKIVEGWLKKLGLSSCWIDMRKTLVTDNRFRDANILENESAIRLREAILSSECEVSVIQGFIGGTLEGQSTTLGREGSDYTAGIVANMLDAKKVVIWKDVPGILNADPDWMPDPEKLDSISYKEAVEMSFSGAKIIHPKTIKPLHNKRIPLYVKSFLDPTLPGTVISSNISNRDSVPVYVRKEKQVLISLMPVDFSFVMGESLGRVFHLFYKFGIKTNLVQASAVSLAVCVDNDINKISRLTDQLKEEFSILYNEDVELVTIRYYNDEAVKRVTEGRSVMLEQKTRRSIRFVLKSTV